MKITGYRLAPDSLITAARAVARNRERNELAQAVEELTQALKQLEALSPPILGVVVRSGQVESLISDRAEILGPMLQDVVVIYSGAMVREPEFVSSDR